MTVTGFCSDAEIGAYTALVAQADRLDYDVVAFTGEVFAAPIDVDEEARLIAVDAEATPAEVIAALTAAVATITATAGGK